MPTESSPLDGTDDPDRSPGYPFRGPGTFIRVAPFAGIAVLAEASLALAPSPASPWAVAVSLVLLLAVAASFALPWERLPTWLPVLVPLTYAGSALALTLAAGTTSGVGLVILVPLVWTALFHRRWESGCMVVAIVAAQVVISLTPVAVADAVFARRVILWAALASVIALATHELRDRSYRARQEAVALQARLTELTVVRDRDRIAADLQDTVIQQVFAAGMKLHSTAMLATDPEVRKRILATADHLDEVLRLTRDAVFGLERRKQERGLRAEIVALCARISPVPEVAFTGPVDGALDPAHATQLVQTLRDALNVISPYTASGRVALTANDTAFSAEIEATGSFPDSDETRAWRARLAESMTGPGISFRIQPESDGMRFTWSIPIASSLASPPSAEPMQKDLSLGGLTHPGWYGGRAKRLTRESAGRRSSAERAVRGLVVPTVHLQRVMRGALPRRSVGARSRLHTERN
jgi:signal transduction histidine kinase